MRDELGLPGEAMSVDGMPWYRFGTLLSQVSRAEQAVRIAGLDWKVAVEQAPADGVGRHVLVCADGSPEEVHRKLADVQPDYRPIQNLDVFAFFDPIIKAGVAVYDSIGTLDNGKWLWTTVRMREEMAIAEGDRVAQFILLAYKHGASAPPTLGFKPVRLAGKITLHDELLYPLIKVRVTREGLTELEGTPEAAIEKIMHHFGSLASRFRGMLGIEMDEKKLGSYLEAVFPKARGSGRGSKYRAPPSRERAIRECTRLFVEGKGNDLPGTRRTLWAAYSAIAEYVDYYEMRVDDPQRLHEIWGSPLKSWAMAKATKLVREL
jgi:hypothetical protein